MEKSNKGLYIGIIAAVILVVAVIVGVILSNNNSEEIEGGDISESQIEDGSTFEEVDQDIPFGSFEEMQDLSKSIQNGEITGQIVRIEGLVSHPMTKYSIVQVSEDGSQKIGTEFEIEGLDESEYPEDGARVVITGEVVEKEPLYFVIRTNPQYVIAVDDVETPLEEDEAGVEEDLETEVEE